MAVVASCIVTRSEEGMGAFGVRADTDENVYFPFSIAESVALEEFDEVEAILVRNDRDEPRWKAIRVRRPVADEEDGAD